MAGDHMDVEGVFEARIPSCTDWRREEAVLVVPLASAAWGFAARIWETIVELHEFLVT